MSSRESRAQKSVQDKNLRYKDCSEPEAGAQNNKQSAGEIEH